MFCGSLVLKVYSIKPAASAPLENLLEMQILDSPPYLINQKFYFVKLILQVIQKHAKFEDTTGWRRSSESSSLGEITDFRHGPSQDLFPQLQNDLATRLW